MMYLPNFEYLAPSTMAEALKLLGQRKNHLVPLAGGTDLLVLMKEGKLQPPALLSVKNLAELKKIEITDQKITIGAGATVAEIEHSPIPQINTAFLDLMDEMATPQIRNRATLGGNLCTAAACADFPPVLLLHDASVQLASQAGTREIPLASFFDGPRQTKRQDHELVVSVTLNQRQGGAAYVKFGVRDAAKIAIVGVAAAVTVKEGIITDLQVAVTAAAPIPMLVPEAAKIAIGQKPQEKLWQAVSEAVPKVLKPIADLRGSIEYRLHLAQVGTVRALSKAYARSCQPGAVIN